MKIWICINIILSLKLNKLVFTFLPADKIFIEVKTNIPGIGTTVHIKLKIK